MGAREAQPSMLLMGVKCLAHAQEYNTMTRLRFKPRPPTLSPARLLSSVSYVYNVLLVNMEMNFSLLSYKFHYYLSGHFNLCGMENQRTSP